MTYVRVYNGLCKVIQSSLYTFNFCIFMLVSIQRSIWHMPVSGQKLWKILFFLSHFKKSFYQANLLKCPVYGHLLGATSTGLLLLYPKSGVDGNGGIFQFSLLIKKNEA